MNAENMDWDHGVGSGQGPGLKSPTNIRKWPYICKMANKINLKAIYSTNWKVQGKHFMPPHFKVGKLILSY